MPSGVQIYADLKESKEPETGNAETRRAVIALTTTCAGAVTGLVLANSFIYAVASTSVEEEWSTSMVSTMTGLAKRENDVALQRMQPCAFMGFAIRFLAMVFGGWFIVVMKSDPLSLSGFALLILQMIMQRHLQQDISQQPSSVDANLIVQRGDYTHTASSAAMLLCTLVYVAACKREGLSLNKAIMAAALGGLAGLDGRLGFQDEYLDQNFDQQSAKTFAAAFYRVYVEVMTNQNLEFLPMAVLFFGASSIVLVRISSAVLFRTIWAGLSTACVAGAVVAGLPFEKLVNSVQDSSNDQAMTKIRNVHTVTALCGSFGALFASIDLARSFNRREQGEQHRKSKSE